jgi:membrane protein YqaA with SNARE-associated domain
MKKRIINFLRTAGFLLGILLLIGLIYTLANYNTINQQISDRLSQQIQKYGYIGIFIISFLLEILPQPFVNPNVPFANALILGLDFRTLLVYMITGAIISDFVAYFLGIYYGERISIQIAGKENYEKGIKIFRKYGKLGMTLLAITPLPYFPILAGVFRMDLKSFIIYAIFPRIIHFIIFPLIIAQFI